MFSIYLDFVLSLLPSTKDLVDFNAKLTSHKNNSSIHVVWMSRLLGELGKVFLKKKAQAGTQLR